MRAALAAAVMITLTGWLLAAGCTDTGSLPTEPESPPTPTVWTRFFPEHSVVAMRAAWGVDIDDMWIVGNNGALLHWDGRRIEWHEVSTTDDLMDIEGCARDDIWIASSGGSVLHFNGHRWSEEQIDSVESLLSVHCAGPGKVYVGGRNLQYDPAIFTHDGARWREMPMADGLSDWIRRIWRSGDGRPLMAATDNTTLMYDSGIWRETEQYAVIRDSDGELVLAELDPEDWGVSLCRVDSAGWLVEICSPDYVAAARDVADCEPVVLNMGRDLGRLDDCIEREFFQGSRRPFQDLAVPVHGGRSIMAVGNEAHVKIITWHDQQMVIRDLIPEIQILPGRELTGDADHLYAVTTRDSLMQLDSDGRSSLIITPLDGNLLGLDSVRALGDGRLVVWNWSEIAARDESGHWEVWPPPPGNPDNMWIDGALRPRILDSWGHLWALDSDAWTSIGTVPIDHSFEHLAAFDGLAPDDLYASIVAWDWDYGTLHRYDGESWREVDLAADLLITALAAGPLTGSLYFRARDTEGQWINGAIRDDEIRLFTAPSIFLHEVIEVTEEVVLARDNGNTYQLEPDGWHTLESPGHGYSDGFWAHPNRGLYLLSNTHEIHHRPLPEGRP